MRNKNPFETIIDNQPFSCWLKDENGNYIAVNKAFADYTGLSKSEIVGKTDFDLYSSEEANVYHTSDLAILNGERQEFYEAIVNGQWKEEYKKIVYDENDQVFGTAGFARDINDRKQIEAALRESETSKSLLLSNLPGVAFRCKNDQEWTMTFLSEGCLELTGYTPEELIGSGSLTYYQLIHPEFKEEIHQKWRADVLANQKSNDEYIITTKSGEEKWVWEQSALMEDSDGGYSEGFILDISNIKEAEKLIKESEDRFRTIFEEAPLGIGIFDTKTGFIYQLNRKFSEILEREPGELCRLDWKSYSHPDELQENIDKLNLLKSKKINGFSMNKRYFKPDGSTIWVNMVVTPFKTEAISHTHLCMIEDITLSKKKEQEITYLSYHDILTGLYNRRFFEEEQKRFDLSRTVPFSLVMGDVNGLKLINDSFGHLEGDKLLKEIADILKHSCRGDDLVSRIGGDEFIILLNQTDEQGAKKLCERIHKACKDYEKNAKQKTYALSISLGFATKTEPNQKIEELLKQAEEMLYTRKNAEKKKVRKNIIEAIKKELIVKSFNSKDDFNQVMGLSLRLGEAMRLSPKKIKELQLLTTFHDIGILSFTEELLAKDREKLSSEELFEYKKHPDTGYRIALGIPLLKNLADEILSHHEHWDGTGYPRGTKGERIPLLARMISIIDAYQEFIKSERNVGENQYNEFMSHMKERSGKHFDPTIVACFIEVLSETPPQIPVSR